MSILASPDFPRRPLLQIASRLVPFVTQLAPFARQLAPFAQQPAQLRSAQVGNPGRLSGHSSRSLRVGKTLYALIFGALLVGEVRWVGPVAVGQDTSALVQSGAASGAYKAVQQPDRVDFLRDGKLITSYQFRSGSKPVMWPIHAGDGHRMTRSYPLDATIPGEAHDHPHHRGLWMTFGDVNGLDWWAEGDGKGLVAHTKVLEVNDGGKSASITAEHDWMTPAKEGQTSVAVLKETCRYVIHGNAEETVIDCEYLWRGVDATKPVVFGDTKEGMFAVRVPESMRGDKPGGEILNSVGDKGGDTWGKSARWVDYSGPVAHNNSDIHGIAILVHPKSFRANGLWHVRTYGLFAHNPFGIKDFLGNRTKTASGTAEPPHAGGYELKPGETLHFYYRVIFHPDRWTIEQGDGRMKEFEKESLELK